MHEESPLFAGATMQVINQQILRIVKSPVSCIYVYGETGTGKEIVADIVEKLCGGPVVRLNCSTLPAALVESELFGHRKSSFTGATHDKKGLFEAAEGGWLFLDEISTLPLGAQAALLRAIENREIRPVGDTKSKKVNVKIIAAGNEDLGKMVQNRDFRGDLLQRLKEIEFRLPPLRERKEEIPKLISFFCASMPGGPYRTTGATVNMLADMNWAEGNVRELRNCLKAMAAFSHNNELTPQLVPSRFLVNTDRINESANSDVIKIPTGSNKGDLNYNILSDRLFVECLRKIHKQHGALSMRKYAEYLGLAGSTVSEKVKSLAAEGVINRGEFFS